MAGKKRKQATVVNNVDTAHVTILTVCSSIKLCRLGMVTRRQFSKCVAPHKKMEVANRHAMTSTKLKTRTVLLLLSLNKFLAVSSRMICRNEYVTRLLKKPA